MPRLCRFLLCLGAMALCALPSVPALCAPVPSPAVPGAVTLYPDGARAVVTQDLPVVNGGVQLVLPPGTLADSVTLLVEGRQVLDLRLTPMEAEDSPEIRQLRAAFETARQALGRLEGELAAVESRRALWTKTETRFTQAADVERMDHLLAERLPALHADEQRIADKLPAARSEFARQEQAMREAGALDTEALSLSAQLSPSDSGTVRATLTYSLIRCGWRPVYRLEARPGNAGEQGRVRCVQEAEIRQGSGQDWRNVRLTLAMGAPGGGLDPAPARPWWIRPRPSAAPADHMRMVRMAETASKADAGGAFAPAPAPRQQTREEAVYTARDLGPRDLPAGRAIRLTLAEEDWPAVFTRLIRPALDSRAYLRASVELPEPRFLPEGEAVYMVTGETVGSGAFRLAGHEADLYFGVDPHVSATMNLDTRQSGRQGFVDRRQTLVWNWTIEVKNAHTQAVAVRLEDARPRAGDEAITVAAVSSPEPGVEEEREQIYVWEFELPAGGSRKLTHRITASAPREMDLQEGR